MSETRTKKFALADNINWQAVLAHEQFNYISERDLHPQGREVTYEVFVEDGESLVIDGVEW